MSLSPLGFLINSFKALRGLFVTLIVLAIVIPVALYIMLSSDWVLNKIRGVGERELTELLGSQVRIGELDFSPFNSLAIKQVTAHDDNDSIALTIADIDARYEFWDLILRQKVVIDYATISGLDLKLYRDSVGAPLNIANIIQRLKGDDRSKEPKHFKLRLNDVSLTDCTISYDDRSKEQTPDRFNASHIRLSDLNLSAFSPIISNDHYNVRLRSLSFNEQSGFKLKSLKANCDITQSSMLLSDLNIALPESDLEFGPLSVPIDSIKAIANIGRDEPLELSLLEGSHIYLPDIKAFVPIFESLDYDLDLNFDVKATLEDIEVNALNISDRNGILNFAASGDFSGINDMSTLAFTDVRFDLATDTVVINRVLRSTKSRVSPMVRRIISNIGYSTITGNADGTLSDGYVDAQVRSRLANAKFNAVFVRRSGAMPYNVDGVLTVDSLLLGRLLADDKFNKLSAVVDVQSSFGRHGIDGNVELTVPRFDFKGYSYHNISGKASIEPSMISADLNVNDRNLSTYITGHWEQLEDRTQLVDAYMILRELRLDSLNIDKSHPGFNLTGLAHIDGEGTSLDSCIANIELSDFRYYNNSGEGLALKELNINADNINAPGRISVTSDYINGSIEGSYRYTTLVPEIKDIYETMLPALAGRKVDLEADEQEAAKGAQAYNNFDYKFTISNCENICDFFKLPVTLIDKAQLQGRIDGVDKLFDLKFDMPWLGQGGNIIESTSLAVNVDADEGVGGISLTSMMPTKKGDMDINANINLDDGVIDSKINWTIRRAIPINGLIDFTTVFARDSEDHLITQVNFNPGKINFGDDIWNIGKSLITYCDNRALINNFAMDTESQSIRVNGIAGPLETDQLKVDLKNIKLIDIFETLEIYNVLISGYATGTIDAAGLLGPAPYINCDHLAVRSIGYNYCTLGDADVKLSVDDGGKRFNFDAEIHGPSGNQSHIDGYIEPATEGLVLNIDADRVKVGFMKPFMSAFTSDIDGFASGKARLYGTFKDLDLEGDVYADDLRIKIDFTNTYYFASDSIHIRPGIINLDNITLHDEYDHTALLNGWVAHKYFHDATFDFAVTKADNFLSYNVTEKLSPLWYGRIFGNGSATVKGGPGIVDIGVNMSTAENSNFTFVLSSSAEASEYSFITFRDMTVRPETDSLKLANVLPDRVRLAKERSGEEDSSSSTAYNMDINVDVTPLTQINIIMDPVGGDRIRAYGSGHMRMTYGSIDNDIRLYGTYTLDRGNYNFTLQDIILKDFTIKEGSSITFLGNPYNAQLDINAYYQVNANLSDLDESFLQDKELNRTNVQVRAILMVKGEMLQPEISFDLEFPTLTQDIYRKVRSIVSTEDMMNRQIIYLLALNRFYTPEYMASTTKGNELFSVASSTISSQLSSMLGKLSENWSIAPNLRSDRGDFSDLEVDLTLTSSLLNNRLLFNGNFGYRDKSLNTNQFIGDFDIEYLLDRTGEWRLKAYNRYNDQNYYLRTAQTTQGVGIVYRRDFDKSFRFLRRKDKDDSEPDTTLRNQTDTIIEKVEIHQTVLPDSLNNDR